MSASFEVLDCLPQAVLRVGGDLRVQWVEPSFRSKTALAVDEGQSLLTILEPCNDRDRMADAICHRRRFVGTLITCALKEVRLQVRPADQEEGAWVILEPAGMDDDVAFAQALQEIARAVGESLEMESVCAAAVVALVRCAQVSRAEVFLVENGHDLRRVASSDLADIHHAEQLSDASGTLKHALATGQPQISFARADDGLGTIFACLPLNARRRTVGVLVLHKEPGASFSARELDLWSAAAGQLAVAVENARLLREAQAALQTRDEFMSIASHELKTPLTPLKMNLFMMERRVNEGLNVELVSIQKAKRQVDRLAGLVNDLLDVSRLEIGKLSVARNTLDVSRLASEVVESFRDAFQREIKLDLPEAAALVLGDRDRLEQVVVNLVENANKYSPPHEPIRVSVEVASNQIRLHVQDRGIGIPGGDQAQIFQRFYRAKNVSNRNFGGLGLGLFISHSIIQAHGGSLSLISDEGQGSTFTVSVPRMIAAGPQASAPTAPTDL